LPDQKCKFALDFRSKATIFAVNNSTEKKPEKRIFMSQLGNLLRHCREAAGAKTQEVIARKTHLHIRTIQRAEQGYDLRLDTLRILVAVYRLSQAEYARLLAAWVIDNLGPDAALLQVRIKGPGKRHPMTKHEEFLEVYAKIPLRYQQELQRACQSPHALRMLANWNAAEASMQKLPDDYAAATHARKEPKQRRKHGKRSHKKVATQNNGG
jgi:hypothetical protein